MYIANANASRRPRLTGLNRVTLSDVVISSTVDDDVLALDLERGLCFGLDGVGARVWQLIATPISVSDLCAILTEEYEVDADMCEAEVTELLQEMAAEGIVIILPDAVRTA